MYKYDNEKLRLWYLIGIYINTNIYKIKYFKIFKIIIKNYTETVKYLAKNYIFIIVNMTE